MNKWFLIASLMIIGCASSNGEDRHTKCVGLSGLYRFQYTTLSGNCGDFPANNAVYPNTTFTNACSYSAIHTSSDNCSSSSEYSCSATCPGITDIRSVNHYVEIDDTIMDASQITGQFSVISYDCNNTLSCSGVYNFIAVRIHQ